jgi:hypothetical protein
MLHFLSHSPFLPPSLPLALSLSLHNFPEGIANSFNIKMVTTRKHDEETGEGGKQQEQQQQKEEGHATKKAKGGEEEESQGGQGGQGGQEEGAAKSKMPEEEERGEGEEEEEEEEEEEGVGEEKQQEGVGEEEQQEGQAEKETTAAAKGQKVAQETKKGKGSRGKTTKSALGLEIGSPAPEFALPNEQGETVALKDFKGKHVAIYFYNKDDTPVVTKGGMAFAKVFPEMQKMGVPLLFIGPDRYEGGARKSTGERRESVCCVCVCVCVRCVALPADSVLIFCAKKIVFYYHCSWCSIH